MGKDTKTTILLIIFSTLLIFGGAYFFTRPQTEKLPPATNSELLVRSDSRKITAANERAVLVEFGDFQCPACSAYYKLVKEVLDENKDNLTFVFRNFPLSQHKNARPSAYAAEAAGNQGKYWEMYGKLYENQTEWSDSDNPQEIFTGYARDMGLDESKFKADMESGDTRSKIDRDYADGVAIGINSTPTFYLNGVKIKSPGSAQEFKDVVKNKITSSPVSSSATEEPFHAHFDLLVYQKGKQIDFAQDKYQSKKGQELNPNIHFHDGNGKVVHMHKKGLTLEDLFGSLSLDIDGEYYVNGEKKTTGEISAYEPNDLDRILILDAGTTQNLRDKWLGVLSNDSCIYSEKCPERGSPPTEECVGGVGTGCERE